jgi:GalNAc-alpha-(1->4)-GalNAc-alpha-(1->3)-diNAcBac-PP-undecaprenol alpha-1,4-N-acetyl-D-galactosaminyltransferase
MTESNVLAVVATKCVGIPVIISERNNPFQESKHLSKFWKVLRRLTYPRANYLVVQTNFIKKFYEKIISQERLKIIPNPINVNFIDFGESKRENIILNVGRLTEQKNHQLLIRTFSKINPPSWELHIAGDGPLRNELKHLIKETEMEGKIKLLGRIKDVATLYQKSKVFALTSKYEGFPNALLEAMHFGLACVSTDCPSGPSELIQDGINGYLTPVDNHELFSEKLKDLVFDENLRVLMGTKAAISVDHLEANKIAIQWLQLINQSLKD